MVLSITFILLLILSNISIDHIEKVSINNNSIKNLFYDKSTQSIKSNVNVQELYEKIIIINKNAIEEEIVGFKGAVYFICIAYLIIVIILTTIFMKKYEKKAVSMLNSEVIELMNIKLQIDNFDFIKEKKVEK
jgi:hypothetical protein